MEQSLEQGQDALQAHQVWAATWEQDWALCEADCGNPFPGLLAGIVADGRGGLRCSTSRRAFRLTDVWPTLRA